VIEIKLSLFGYSKIYKEKHERMNVLNVVESGYGDLVSLSGLFE
jgi:hypothetical protein